MAESIRVLYLGVHGRHHMNYNWNQIDEGTAVVITACEWGIPEAPEVEVNTLHELDKEGPFAGQAAATGPMVENGWFFVGNAVIDVTNICPHGAQNSVASVPNGVEFYLHVFNDDPLNVMVTITALGPAEPVDVVFPS